MKIKTNCIDNVSNIMNNFCRALLCKRGLCRHAVSVCLSVCPSVTFVNSVKVSNHILRIFSPSGSQTILVFAHQHQTLWRYSDGDLLNGGVECRWCKKQELSYRQQIARQLRTQYVEGIYRHKYYTMTLKCRLRVTQVH